MAELVRLVVPADAVVVYALVGEAVAVYSVAARTTLPVTLRAVGVLVGFEVLVSLAADGVGPVDPVWVPAAGNLLVDGSVH